MIATTLTKKRFDNLELYHLPSSVYNTEAQLFIFRTKDKWVTVNKLLKKFYIRSGPQFGNKLQTINSLLDNKDILYMDEIVFPDSLAIVDKEVVGFIMPLIKSENLSVILNNPLIDVDVKINYLYQVGSILEKMETLRSHSAISDFYLNDLHENNFIVLPNGEIKVIDIDSCKILNNKTFPSRYLSKNSLANNISKYDKVLDQSCMGYIEPSEDTEIYCYIIMILNLLYGSNINNISLDEFYDFINYLESIGINKEILYLFENIVTNSKNINPYELLDTLTPYVGRSRAYRHIKK